MQAASGARVCSFSQAASSIWAWVSTGWGSSRSSTGRVIHLGLVDQAQYALHLLRPERHDHQAARATAPASSAGRW